MFGCFLFDFSFRLIDAYECHPSTSCVATTLFQKKSCAFAARCVASTAQSMIVCVDAWVSVERYEESYNRFFISFTWTIRQPLGLSSRPCVDAHLVAAVFMFVQYMLLS